MLLCVLPLACGQAPAFYVMSGGCYVDSSSGCVMSTNFPANSPTGDVCSVGCRACSNALFQVYLLDVGQFDVFMIGGVNFTGSGAPLNSLPASNFTFVGYPNYSGGWGARWGLCLMLVTSTTTATRTVTATLTSSTTTETRTTETYTTSTVLYDGCASAGQTCSVSQYRRLRSSGSQNIGTSFQRCGMSVAGTLNCLAGLDASCAGKKAGDPCDDVPPDAQFSWWTRGGTCAAQTQAQCSWSYSVKECGVLQCVGYTTSPLSLSATIGVAVGVPLGLLVAFVGMPVAYLLWYRNQLQRRKWIPSSTAGQIAPGS